MKTMNFEANVQIREKLNSMHFCKNQKISMII